MCVDRGVDIDTSVCLQCATDLNYPLATSEAALDPHHHFSSMLYRVERGTPLLSESNNMFPLEMSPASQPLRIFTVISDMPLDIIPITQRSYSNNWSTIVIMTSSSLSESSLFSINHAGKFQAVMEKTDVIFTEPTLAFFRIRRQLLIQVTKGTLNLLQLKNCRHPTSGSATTLLVSSLSFPSGSSIQHVAFQSAALWTKESDSCGASANIFNKRSHYNASVFAVSSRNKLVLIQLVEGKSKLEKSNSANDDKEYPCTMQEVFSHTMSSDIHALALSENRDEVHGEKKLLLAVTHWDSCRSVQILSVLLSRGSCCILSIVNSSDMQLTPSLRDRHTGNEAIGALPFQFVHVCPTLRPQNVTQRERCYVVGGCVDGHLVIFEYEYLPDSCLWKEMQQWSSLVQGGILNVSLLNFYDKEQYHFESSLTATASDRRHSNREVPSNTNSNILHVSAFIVNGRDGDFVYRFKLSTGDMKHSSQLCSDIQVTRALRQSKGRSQLCAVHPLYLSRSLKRPVQNDNAPTSDNEHVYIDNYLWLASTRDTDHSTDPKDSSSSQHMSLCIGSKSIYHNSSLAVVSVATKGRRVSFRILNMIYLNNPTSCNGTHSNSSRQRKAYVLIMYSHLCPSQTPLECPEMRIGVQILDCDTLSTLWEYSPEVQSDIQSAALYTQVDNTVVAIALAPHWRQHPPPSSVQQTTDEETRRPLLFSFLVMHSYQHTNNRRQQRATGQRSSVMCSLFCGEEVESNLLSDSSATSLRTSAPIRNLLFIFCTF